VDETLAMMPMKTPAGGVVDYLPFFANRWT
jgi:hypothetical protein